MSKTEWDLIKEQISVLSTCCCFEKKKNNNPDFLQFLPGFFQVWNIALQISRLFQEFKEFKALYEPFELVP